MRLQLLASPVLASDFVTVVLAQSLVDCGVRPDIISRKVNLHEERGRRPWEVFSVSLPEDARRHIVIARRGPKQEEAFFRGIAREIDDAPVSGAFVFVHGRNVSFDEAVLRTGQLAWDMKLRGPAVTYSWPSAGDGEVRFRPYNGGLAAPHRPTFLQELRTRRGSGRCIWWRIAWGAGC